MENESLVKIPMETDIHFNINVHSNAHTRANDRPPNDVQVPTKFRRPRPLHEITAAWHTHHKLPNSHTPQTSKLTHTQNTQTHTLIDLPVITTIKRLDRFLGGFPPAQVSLLEGYHEFMLNLIARIIVHTVKISDRDVIYIDGGNTLNPYLLTSACRLFKVNADRILRHVQVARAFTVFQLDTLITQNLEQILAEHNPKLVLISCFSELYLDRDVNWSEAKTLFTSGFDWLESLTKKYGITTIMTDFGRDKSIHRFELSRRLRDWLPPDVRVSLKRPSANRLRFVKGTGEFLDYLPLPPYQWSLDDFYPGGDLCG